MRLATFRDPSGTVRSGEVRDGSVVAFADGATTLQRLTSRDRAPASGEAFSLGAVELLAPVPRPRAIFGIGLNYRAHVEETGATPPERPVVFMKLPTSSVAPGGPIRCPEVVRRLDYEGELAVVIHGPQGQKVSAPFARVHWGSRFCRSRAETSSATA